MNLREARCKFSELLVELLFYAQENDYNFALDEVANHQNVGHMAGSLHYSGCAFDLILYDTAGNYETGTLAYLELGEHWKVLSEHCRWGGDFSKPDGNHFSFSPPEIFGNKA